MVTAAALLVPLASGGSFAGPEAGTAVFFTMLAVCAAGLLVVTGPRSPLTPATVVLAAAGGLVTGLGVFMLMPFERAGSPLAGRLPGGLGWLILALVVAVPCWVLVDAERRQPGQGAYAFWQLSAVAAVIVFATALVAIRLFPGAIPDIVPVSVVWQGDGPAKALQYAREQSAVEAVDPYVLPLFIGSVLFGILAVVATLGRRPRPARAA
jgi:hypothetical protein